jgi:hypothetical protein
MTQTFELIRGGGYDPMYRAAVDQHLETVEMFNRDDKQWAQSHRWNHLLEVDESMRHDPNYASPAAARRIEIAWDLARKGSGLWLAGCVNLLGGADGVYYTPFSVKWMEDFLDNDFTAEEKSAFNYKNQSRLELERVV